MTLEEEKRLFYKTTHALYMETFGNRLIEIMKETPDKPMILCASTIQGMSKLIRSCQKDGWILKGGMTYEDGEFYQVMQRINRD